MAPIRIALLVLFCSSSIAHAGALITLVPQLFQPAGGYVPGQVLRIDVLAQLNWQSPPYLGVQVLQFDFSDTDPRLAVEPVLSHSNTQSHGDIYFWDFSSSINCQYSAAECGNYTIIDSEMASDQIAKVTFTGISVDYGPIKLHQSVSKRVGILEVTMPYLDYPGVVVLDVLNADDSDPLRGARLSHWVYPTNPVHWSAHDGTITGGRLAIVVIPEPATLSLLVVGAGVLTSRKGHLQ